MIVWCPPARAVVMVQQNAKSRVRIFIYRTASRRLIRSHLFFHKIPVCKQSFQMIDDPCVTCWTVVCNQRIPAISTKFLEAISHWFAGPQISYS